MSRAAGIGQIKAKICGLKTPDMIHVAVEAGVDAVGFVFFPPSPRAVTPELVGPLAASARNVKRVGLFVDPIDDLLHDASDAGELDLIQLHGSESPERVAEIRDLTGIEVMKAIKVENADDFVSVSAYEEVADWLLFDAKAPKALKNALPGGNGISFDWTLLADRNWVKPWMLSGGLTVENLVDAVRVSGAAWVDVSSGVEARPGEKSADLIRHFLEQVNSI